MVHSWVEPVDTGNKLGEDQVPMRHVQREQDVLCQSPAAQRAHSQCGSTFD